MKNKNEVIYHENHEVNEEKEITLRVLRDLRGEKNRLNPHIPLWIAIFFSGQAGS